MLTLQQEEMLSQAIEEHGEVTPCSNKEWWECFTYFEDDILFWFNTKDNSTRLIRVLAK